MKSRDILVLCLVFLGIMASRLPFIWSQGWINRLAIPMAVCFACWAVPAWFFYKERRFHLFMLPLLLASVLAAYHLLTGKTTSMMVLYTYIGAGGLAYYLRPLEKM